MTDGQNHPEETVAKPCVVEAFEGAVVVECGTAGTSLTPAVAPDAGKGPSFAMVTCDPNALVAPIHPKAMITILDPADHERWLSGSYDEVVALQRPYPADKMTVRGPVFPTRSTSV